VLSRVALGHSPGRVQVALFGEGFRNQEMSEPAPEKLLLVVFMVLPGFVLRLRSRNLDVC
jgi:hypothetical protein